MSRCLSLTPVIHPPLLPTSFSLFRHSYFLFCLWFSNAALSVYGHTSTTLTNISPHFCVCLFESKKRKLKREGREKKDCQRGKCDDDGSRFAAGDAKLSREMAQNEIFLQNVSIFFIFKSLFNILEL